MESFFRSVRSTPAGEIARALKLHPGLLYTDEKATRGGKGGDETGAECTTASNMVDEDSKKEIVLVQWYVDPKLDSTTFGSLY